MKLLVMSDNHGRWSTVNEIIEKFRPQVDLVIHCGDSEFPSDDPIWEKVDLVVGGNMDFDPQYMKVKTLDTSLGKLLVVHGHRNGVNYGNDELALEGKKQGAAYIFHGHTHKLYAEKKRDVFIMNPGSLNHSRGPIPYKTFAVVTIDSPDKIKVEYYDDDRNFLPQLTVSIGD